MFENQSIRFNFVIIDFEKFDENIKSYNSYFIFESINNIEQFTSINSTSFIETSLSMSSFNYFINYNVIDLILILI